MKKTNHNIFRRISSSDSLLLTAATCSMSLLYACSDDHFTINDDVVAQQTIWKNIQSNENLSEYADILKSTYYSQTEEKTTKQTYADILNGDQTFTVWAPENGTFNYSYYKQLLNSGVRDSIYKVENNLIRNNLARYTNIYNSTDSVKIDLFNNKAAWLNYDKQTIKGNKVSCPNISSANGVLHIVEKPVDYQYNLYEYMASNPQLSCIDSFIKSYQTKKFDENRSIQGPTVNSEITWVDSVTYTSNFYTEYYLNSYLNREDSNYVMILPTNEAWNATLEKTKLYYNYINSYVQDVAGQTETGADTIYKGSETKFTDYELDSLRNLRSKDAICNNLVYNANWQYEQIPITTIKDIAKADSLLTTSGNKFKKTGTLNSTNSTSTTFELDNFTTMFGGNDPIELSNGYAYLVNEWSLPATSYAKTITKNAIAAYNTHDTACKEVSSLNWSLTTKDSTYNYRYLTMTATSSNSKPGADFGINNVLSCKYDVYVVLGYNTSYNRQNKFYAYMKYVDAKGNSQNLQLKNPAHVIDASGTDLYGNKYYVNSEPKIDSTGEKTIVEYTDTILLAEDFEFPVCYYGLENAYPVLTLKAAFLSKEKEYYTNELWVNSFIFKAKEW